MIETRHGGFQPNAITFAVLISAYKAGQRWQQALGSLNEIRNSGMQPSVITFLRDRRLPGVSSGSERSAGMILIVDGPPSTPAQVGRGRWRCDVPGRRTVAGTTVLVLTVCAGRLGPCMARVSNYSHRLDGVLMERACTLVRP